MKTPNSTIWRKSHRYSFNFRHKPVLWSLREAWRKAPMTTVEGRQYSAISEAIAEAWRAGYRAAEKSAK